MKQRAGASEREQRTKKRAGDRERQTSSICMERRAEIRDQTEQMAARELRAQFREEDRGQNAESRELREGRSAKRQQISEIAAGANIGQESNGKGSRSAAKSRGSLIRM
jgi:type II secretory pathway component PulJ